MSSPVWAGISESAKNLVTRLLTVDPQERITVTEALQHPWIADRKRVCNSKNLNQTITNLSKFNARRRLKGAVSDAFASRLPPQVEQDAQPPNLGVAEVLDSLDEIDAIGNNDPAGLDDPSLQKWLDIFDGISRYKYLFYCYVLLIIVLNYLRKNPQILVQSSATEK